MKHRSTLRRDRKPFSRPQPRSLQNLSSPAPFDVGAAFSQAMALHRAGRIAEAETAYRRILAAQPEHFDSLHLLGVVHHQRGDHVEAVRQIDAALRLNPNSASAHSNRGSALQALGHLDQALASYDKALALRPSHSEVLFNRGNVLQSLSRLDAALASFDAALTVRPDYADALVNRGGVLQELERLPEALASYDRAIALKPDYAEAFYNRAIVLREMNRIKESISDYDRAITLKLGDRYLKGARLHAKMLICDWSNLDEDIAQLTSAIASGVPASLPFPFLAIPASPCEQRKCAELHVADKFPSVPVPLWRGERYSHDRIRVAYLSADFHDHAVPQLTAGLFENHDRTRFETIAISLAPCRQDRMRERLSRSFDRFLDVATAKNHEVAVLMRELEIDIAVDLNGFTKGARPGIFVRRPAPVQVNYLGYAGTLGPSHWDYIIADRFVIPQGCHEHYGEKVVYLPDSYLPHDRTRRISAHTPSRADAGLPEQGLVFCCFNNAYKITPDVFDVWMRLLRAVAGSVLWLSGANPGAVENLRVEATRRGVSPERLVFAAKIPAMEEHLARHRLADLLLDTLYYNAHTTAIDALWAGLPVLTCAGTTLASRGAGSLLTAVGLPELVTSSLADYEALALRLARDSALLTGIKQKLARNRTTHSLFDTERFTRHIEAAYVTMWERSQRGEAAASFSVPAID